MSEELLNCPFCGSCACEDVAGHGYTENICCRNEHCCLYDIGASKDEWNTRANPSDTVTLSRAEFEKILSRFKYCLDELWYEYKRSYSKDRFRDYFAEEYEALAILEKNGGA